MTTTTDTVEVYRGLNDSWAGAMTTARLITASNSFLPKPASRARVFRVATHRSTFPGQTYGWRVVGVRAA